MTAIDAGFQLTIALLVTLVLLILTALALLHTRRQLSDTRRSFNATLSDDNLILANLPDLVWFKDAQGIYLACNPAVEQLLGRSRNQIVGKTDFQLLDVALAREARRQDRVALETGEISRDEAWFTFRGNGRSSYLQTTRRAIYDEAGRLVGLLGVGRDITALHKAQHELRLRDHYQRAVLDNFPAMVWLKDTDSRFLAVNQRFAEAAGVESPQELINKNDLDIWPPELARRYRANDRAVMSTGQKIELEEQIRDAGEERWHETYKAPVFDNTGKLLGTVGFARDVSTRHEMETALRASESRFRHFFADNSLVMLLIDPTSGEIIEANAAAAAFYGYPPERLPGMSIDELNTLSAGEIAAARVEAARREQNHFQFQHRLADGRIRDVEVHSTPIQNGGRELLFSVIQDVTERLQAEQALVDERHRLQSVIEGTRVGTWEWNVQTGETRFNEHWAEIIGYRLEELQPVSIDTWAGHAHPDDLAESGEVLERHFAGELAYYEMEARMRHRDGHWVWVLDRGRVFEWTDDGRPLWMAGTHQDITKRKRAEAALRGSEQRLRVASEALFDLIYEWDPATDRLDWFGDVAAVLGYERESVCGDIAHWLGLIHPDDREELERAAENARQDPTPFTYGYRIRHKDGSYRFWSDRAAPLLDEDGVVQRWIGVCHDVTERRHTEEQQRLAATVFEHAHEGILVTDADVNIIDVNGAFTEITGYSRDEAIGRNPRFLSSGTQDRQFYQDMWETLDRSDRWAGEVWNRRKDGEEYAETLSITVVRDADGGIRNYVALFSDITAQKLHQQQLEHIAYYDTLTGLPNRLLLSDRLHHAMNRVHRHGDLLAVVYMDLDGFKTINDAHGHDSGDQLLIELAGRFKLALRGEDTVGRLGGDEFVAVLTGLERVDDCIEFLPRLLEVAARPFRKGEELLQVSASLGVTLYPQADAVDADQLLRQADQAMYQAKLAGKNRYHFFDADQDRHLRDHVEIIEQVGDGLAADEFTLFYQPKVNMHSGEIIGAEALVRWPQADGSIRQPGEFLPLIEQHQLSIELDQWVLDQAMNQLEAWQRQGIALNLSINVSAYHLQHGDFGANLERALQRHPDVPPGRLTVEILETTALMDLRKISAVILDGQALGVRFALDDFGTGYSSLDYLKNLPAEELKIDRGFVRDMLDDRDDLAILEGIMGLSTAFGRTPIAEGVESIEHGEILLQLGCEVAQGYGIGRPMPVADLHAWMASWEAPAEWRRQQRVPHDELPLVFALIEHRSWVRTVTDAISDDDSERPITDARLCAFGGWLDEAARERYQGQPAFGEVRALHHQVHETAEQLLDLAANGKRDEAMARTDELLLIRDRLGDRLKSLLQCRQPSRRGQAPPTMRSSG